MTAPTFGQIRAQISAIRKQHGIGDSRVYGIHTLARYTGKTDGEIGEERIEIVQCESELAMRVALQEANDRGAARVLLTNLSTEQLSTDVRVRLARRKVYSIKKWQIVKELFQARSLDPRISGHNWIAERLLDLAPASDYPPAPGGVVDAETVWNILLDREIGLPVVHPDLIGILKWSMDVKNVQRFCDQPREFQEAATAWLAQAGGIATSAVMTSLAKTGQPIAVPIGLALTVIGHKAAGGSLESARVRIEERYIAEGKLTASVAEEWQQAATSLLRFHLPDSKERREWLSKGDDLLSEVAALPMAYLSKTSPAGFEQRLDRFGKAVAAATESRVTEVPKAVNEAYENVVSHEESTWQRGSRRLDRVEMSARLLRWIAKQNSSPAPTFASLGQAAQWYGTDGGFVDWARYTLQSGEPARKLSEAYNRLVQKVIEIRNRQNQRFAELVRDWTAAGSTGDEVLPVERVLAEFVAPLAAHAPLLVLLIDGMSFAVFRELVADITRQDWVEIRRKDKSPIWPAIATLPSVTEVARTSLFCGALRQGNQNVEKTEFPKHPELLHHSQTAHPPILFHKNELQSRDETSLSDEVIKAFESKRRVIGAVINAVDDFLLKGEQLDIRWSKDEIKVLPQLLYEAKSAGRMVVLLSDHGHILDRETTQRKEEGGERWRHLGTPEDGEIAISGERCVIPESHELIVPWSEKIRYGIKKNGYHGGVTMQEMLVPMAVVSAREELPDDWIEPPSDIPEWWFEPIAATAEVQIAPRVERPVEPVTKVAPRGRLFNEQHFEDVDLRPNAATVEQPQTPTAAWIDKLFASSVFTSQKAMAGRKPPDDELIRNLLVAIQQQGGKLTSTALSRKMNIPPFRLSTTLAAIQRVLNVDGYSILTKDDASDSVVVNVPLLCIQFGIDSGENQ